MREDTTLRYGVAYVKIVVRRSINVNSVTMNKLSSWDMMLDYVRIIYQNAYVCNINLKGDKMTNIHIHMICNKPGEWRKCKECSIGYSNDWIGVSNMCPECGSMNTEYMEKPKQDENDKQRVQFNENST